jgi:hypothetical protein
VSLDISTDCACYPLLITDRKISYMESICKIIARAQITNGGPVILFQPENEYSTAYGTEFDGKYMQYVIDQGRKAGIVVPTVNNDAWAGGNNAPGSGPGAVDIYVSWNQSHRPGLPNTDQGA